MNKTFSSSDWSHGTSIIPWLCPIALSYTPSFDGLDECMKSMQRHQQATKAIK